MSYLLNCISPLTTAVSSISTCTEKVCAWGRSVKKFTVDHAPTITRFTIGTISVTLLGKSIFELYEESQKSDPDSLKVTMLSGTIGASTKAAFEAVFIDSGLARTFHNAISRWAYEIYLILWNVYLNIPSKQQQAFIDTIIAFFGCKVAGDIIQLAKQYRANRNKYDQINNQMIAESLDSEEEASSSALLNSKIEISGASSQLTEAILNLIKLYKADQTACNKINDKVSKLILNKAIAEQFPLNKTAHEQILDETISEEILEEIINDEILNKVISEHSFAINISDGERCPLLSQIHQQNTIENPKEEIVTQLLGLPNYNNLLGIVLMNLAFIAGGIGLVEKAPSDDEALKTFMEVVGYLTTGVGAGALLSEVFRQYWEKWQVSHGSDSFLTKSMGWAIKIIESFGIEAIAVLPYNAVHKSVFAVGGFLMGMYNTFYQRNFQRLTPQQYNEQVKKNTYKNSKGETCFNTALKIDMALSLIFFYIVTGFFNAGSVMTPTISGREDILDVNETFLVITPLLLLMAFLWKPGKNDAWYNRLFNLLFYYLFHPLSFTTIAYMACSQISQVNSDSLNQDSPTQRVFGLLGTLLYVTILVSGRIQNISSSRETEYVITSSTFRMVCYKTLIDFLRGKLPTH